MLAVWLVLRFSGGIVQDAAAGRHRGADPHRRPAAGRDRGAAHRRRHRRLRHRVREPEPGRRRSCRAGRVAPGRQTGRVAAAYVGPPAAGIGGASPSSSGFRRSRSGCSSARPASSAAYEDCPRRYRYSYVDRPTPPKGPPWAHNSLGASVHTALRSWFDLPPARRQPGGAAGPAQGHLGRARATATTTQERAAYERALGWLEALRGGRSTRTSSRSASSGSVGAKTATLALSGRVDRIDDRSGRPSW